MRSSIVIAAFAAFISSVTAADAVKGAAEGFAKGTKTTQDFKKAYI
jgi:pectin lyase